MHLPVLIQDLAVILGVAAIVTLIFRRIRQPVVLGYVAAGIIVGPYTPPIISVVDLTGIAIWADLGVIFLMFALGLEFSFRRLVKVGHSALTTAVFQITTMFIAGFWLARLLGWTSIEGIFLGAMLSISSTTIIIKSLEELGLKRKRFAELVFGVLIVEDLAAILMLVALTSIATTASLNGLDLLLAGGKLALVAGSWLIVGMFAVPKLIKAASRRGSDEMLVVLCLGLCLALVSLSASFGYSAALGAFIMGSILAESTEIQRIERLIAPLKDIFGAIFFVSIGMLLDPKIVLENLGTLSIICAVIIAGQIASVFSGAILSGQSLGISLSAALSMAQIGEFSFIIAGLGKHYGVIDPKLFPLIIAASLLTTLTTPYFMRIAPTLTALIERLLPRRATATIERYTAWWQVRKVGAAEQKTHRSLVLRWLTNALIVTSIYLAASDILTPRIVVFIENVDIATFIAWLITTSIASPFIYALFSTFLRRNTAQLSGAKAPATGWLVLSSLVTALMIGLLSTKFFPTRAALFVTLGAAGLLLFAMRRTIAAFYRWFEANFVAGFSQTTPLASEPPVSTILPEDVNVFNRFAPWEGSLWEVPLAPSSMLCGKSLLSLRLREQSGVSVVVIKRANRPIVAPRAEEILFPHDVLLCYGTEQQLEAFRQKADTPERRQGTYDLASFALRPFTLEPGTLLIGQTVQSCGIRERYLSMVLALERAGNRMQNVPSDLVLAEGDMVWIVGPLVQLENLAQAITAPSSP